jgi:hypothetical protein
MSSKDIFTENGRIKLSSGVIVSREPLVLVGNLESTIYGTLHDSENTRTGCGEVKSDIKKDQERSSIGFTFLDQEVFTIRLGLANVLLVHAQFGKHTASGKETSGVRGSVVLLAGGLVKTSSIFGQLMRVGSTKNNVRPDSSIRNLTGYILVGKSHYKSVFRRVILVLVLEN